MAQQDNQTQINSNGSYSEPPSVSVVTMNENNELSPSIIIEDPVLDVPESPKPMAFTVDFGGGKSIDTHRHKALVEKFQRKHRRGQSMSKLEQNPTSPASKKHPLTGNLPRKASFQSDGYFSSDEKSDRARSARPATKRSELSLPLRNTTISDKMTQSCPGADLFNSADDTPDVDLKNMPTPELDPISPYSPAVELIPQTSPDVRNEFIDGTEFDFDKSDTVSDAGTYTLDADNYSEEQKVRMSIDTEFKIEQEVSVLKKTEEYIKSLSLYSNKEEVSQDLVVEHKSPKPVNKFTQKSYKLMNNKMLSPILSPTQNLSITEPAQNESKMLNNGVAHEPSKTFTRILFPSAKSKNESGLEQFVDQGSVISVTSSGAFKVKPELETPKVRRCSLVKTEVQVETYVDNQPTSNVVPVKKLTANLVNVQSISIRCDKDDDCAEDTETGVISSKLVLGKVSNLPPSVGGISGKASPSKIPSPIHAITRPRSRNGTFDLSDSSLETESYLKPTQNCINALQQRLSLDSDADSDYDGKWGANLNNSPANLLKLRGTHTRHNSLDDKAMKISNKLEHFQSKNLQGIDQTFVNQCNSKGAHKIQNSPNNSPLRRSSSFSTKNQTLVKNTNLQKELNSMHSPNFAAKNASIQRSASTADIKPTYLNLRRSSVNSTDHRKIDRTQFRDTESSSEEEYDKGQSRRRDLANLMNTRYNRAFSLRRARLDEPAAPKCPNTPEMRRKFQPEHVRAISVDRKPMRTNEVQSRYMLNVTKKATPSAPMMAYKPEPVKNVPKVASVAPKAAPLTKPQVFSRTDSGRFSMRTTNKPAASGGPKNVKKDGNGKKSNGRSNSSLSSREKEFQNWKRRKSYDPMKAAAEGKRKEIAKRHTNVMTQSCQEASPNQDCDSSPSHSSSVHRSQSFHGTAALEQLASSEEEEDLTLSADEGFSPPTPSPCELSPARASLRNTWRDHVLH